MEYFRQQHLPVPCLLNYKSEMWQSIKKHSVLFQNQIYQEILSNYKYYYKYYSQVVKNEMRNILEQFEINVQTFEWKLQGWAGGTNNTINYVSEVIKT